MRLSLGETDQTNLTANVLADLGLDSDTENNDELGIGNIDVNLDTLLDEDYVSCTNVVGSLLAASGTGFDATEPEASPVLPSGTGSNAYEPEGYPNQPSGTGFNATEPEVNPNQPSGTGYNAIESEVRPVLNLHDEACEDEVTTDLAQPPVSEARSITCSPEGYTSGKGTNPSTKQETPVTYSKKGTHEGYKPQATRQVSEPYQGSEQQEQQTESFGEGGGKQGL